MKTTSLSLFGLAMILSIASFASADKQILQLTVTDQSSRQMDVTTVYFAAGATASYAFPQDVRKNIDSAGDRPQIFSLTSDGVACTSNGAGQLAATTIIPLSIYATAGLTYTIAMPQSFNFNGTTQMLLEDRLTGKVTNLRESAATVKIVHYGLVNNRFYLHVTAPVSITTLAAAGSTGSGAVAIAQDSSAHWTSCVVFDAAFHRVAAYENVAGNLSFTGLAPGKYEVAFISNTYRAHESVSINVSPVNETATPSAINNTPVQQSDYYSAASNTVACK